MVPRMGVRGTGQSLVSAVSSHGASNGHEGYGAVVGVVCE